MNDETIIILGIILLGVGAIIGALTYHLIVYRFSNKIEKQLDTWNALISNSFLPEHFRSEYQNLLKNRSLVFF